jgi:hypothetical protein
MLTYCLKYRGLAVPAIVLPEYDPSARADERRDRAPPIAMLIPENFAEAAPQQAAWQRRERRQMRG